MNIALYTNENMIVIFPGERKVSCRDVIRQFMRNKPKYAVFFNGKSCVLDTQDIFFLESYYRKTSVVMVKGRIRIKARLDEEERKLPKDQFIRINRHNIINMQYVRNVKGEEIEMQNGELLYVNDGRKKNFRIKYRKFLKENNMIL